MTTTSPPSGSADRPRTPSTAFGRLHPKIQRWVYEQGWADLRDAQEQAIPALLDGDGDLILTAATAAGKTEAAFLPICSRIVEQGTGGLRALYVSPLKALINDQFHRLDALCEALGIPVHRWHGDVAGNRKRAVLERPEGILLITPESLEALFVIHGHRLPQVFAALDCVVVDELHAFIGTERGRQLQSLLHRLELVLGRRLCRVGLSATLGDMDLARAALRPRDVERVQVITSQDGERELRLQVRGYRQAAPTRGRRCETAGSASEDEPDGSALEIARHLYRHLHGSHNLVFANSREDVERFTDLLRRVGEEAHQPQEFWAHHGSLSKEHREEVEAALKGREAPATAVCTSTLELGIDIGDVKSVAQIGAPFSVASLRQRLGRSGRRPGEPAILRVYIREPVITAESALIDGLHLDLVQSIASLELLLAGWCEPPELGALHLSTLVHQVLALVAQWGGVSAQRAWQTLCETGPFEAVERSLFRDVLRAMGEDKLLMQDPSGTLLLGELGERLVGHYSFFAVFHSPVELRVLHAGRLIGTISPHFALAEDMHLILAGKRWRVTSVSEADRCVEVVPAPGGKVPYFPGAAHGSVHDRVRQEMRAILASTKVPAYLDAGARALLDEARATYRRLGLARTAIVEDGQDAVLFLWHGDRVVNNVSVLLASQGLEVTTTGPAITVRGTAVAGLQEALAGMVRQPAPDPVALAAAVPNKRAAKYDDHLTEALLSVDYAARMLDVQGALAGIRGSM